jgi:SMODS-associating 4TM effector domain
LLGSIAIFVVLLVVTLYLNLQLSEALLTLAVPALPMLSWTWREWIRQKDQVAAQERIKNIIQKTIKEIGDGALTGEVTRSRVRQIQDEIHKSRSSDPLIFDWIYALARSASEKTLNAAAEDYVTEILTKKGSA